MSTYPLPYLVPRMGGVWLPKPYEKATIVKHMNAYWISHEVCRAKDEPSKSDKWKEIKIYPLATQTVYDVVIHREPDAIYPI